MAYLELIKISLWDVKSGPIKTSQIRVNVFEKVYQQVRSEWSNQHFVMDISFKFIGSSPLCVHCNILEAVIGSENVFTRWLHLEMVVNASEKDQKKRQSDRVWYVVWQDWENACTGHHGLGPAWNSPLHAGCKPNTMCYNDKAAKNAINKVQYINFACNKQVGVSSSFKDSLVYELHVCSAQPMIGWSLGSGASSSLFCILCTYNHHFLNLSFSSSEETCLAR